MTAAVSILSWSARCSTAALLGAFDEANAEFLDGHLRDLAGDVILECEALESLDDTSADVLLAFRRAVNDRGSHVMFRGIPSACREALVARASRRHAFRRQGACRKRGYSASGWYATRTVITRSPADPLIAVIWILA